MSSLSAHVHWHTGRDGGMTSAEKRELRGRLWEDAGGRCFYCRVRLAKRDVTLDHYLSTALGGTDEYRNLRCACSPCNRKKADMAPAEWERVKPAPVEDEQRETRTEILQRIAWMARDARERMA